MGTVTIAFHAHVEKIRGASAQDRSDSISPELLSSCSQNGLCYWTIKNSLISGGAFNFQTKRGASGNKPKAQIKRLLPLIKPM